MRPDRLVMRDLFSDLPEHENDNYATRLARSWIEGDPVLAERCIEIARDHLEDGSADNAFVDELRAMVVTEALLTEHHALFIELFTEDCREIQWSEIASFFVDSLAIDL